jgi:hypothetical protein
MVDTPPSPFLCCVLWTDKSIFARNCVHSLHNLQAWAVENPHTIRHSNKDLVPMSALNHSWLHNQTAYNAGWSWWSTLYWFPWGNTLIFIGGCASTCMLKHMISGHCCSSSVCRWIYFSCAILIALWCFSIVPLFWSKVLIFSGLFTYFFCSKYAGLIWVDTGRCQ